MTVKIIFVENGQEVEPSKDSKKHDLGLTEQQIHDGWANMAKNNRDALREAALTFAQVSGYTEDDKWVAR